MNATNRYRSLRCARALTRYDTDFEPTGCLIDLLADARHWCDRHGNDFAQLDRQAYEHYLSELHVAKARS